MGWVNTMVCRGKGVCRVVSDKEQTSAGGVGIAGRLSVPLVSSFYGRLGLLLGGAASLPMPC